MAGNDAGPVGVEVVGAVVMGRSFGVAGGSWVPVGGVAAGRGFPSPPGFEILPAMNTFVSAVLILWILGMVIYLTKDM